MVNPGITSKPSIVGVRNNHALNSAKFDRTCSIKEQNKLVGGYFDRLPCDILHNIALMLPFDSIIQLKCSSKFWYNCLTDPKFVDLHLTHALHKSRGCLFIAADNYSGNNYEMYTLEQTGAHLTTSKIGKYSYQRYFYKFQSSGGFICIYSTESKSFRIFNPHIGQEVQVLDVPKFKECRNNLPWWFFSYSPSTKEYKILKIGRVYREDDIGTKVSERNVAAITTLGSNIWWEIQNVPPRLSYRFFTECQGTLFWLAGGSGLVSFDLVSEKFQEIPGPPSDPVDVIRNSNELVNDKLISMGRTIGYLKKDRRLWVLEDKTKGVWMLKYDFSIPPLHKYASGLECISGNGGLFGFIGYSTRVFRQDMTRSHFKAIEIGLDKYIGEKNPVITLFFAPHVRSLVSPVRVMEIGSKQPPGSGQQIYDHSDLLDISLRKKWVLETLKLDYDASEDDLFSNMYKFMREYDDQPRLKRP